MLNRKQPATEQLTPMHFRSMECNQPELAPEDYRPMTDNGPMVYDEEVNNLEPEMPWRTLFAGGSNRLHFVATDDASDPHFVEQVSLSGQYQACGPGYGETFDDVRDAFYYAEAKMKGMEPTPRQ